MTRLAKNVTVGALVALLSGCSGGGNALVPQIERADGSVSANPSGVLASATTGAVARRIDRSLGYHSLVTQRDAVVSACSATSDPMRATCLSKLRLLNVVPSALSAVSGLAPTDLASLYGFSNSQSSTNAVVGIVVAYDNPNAESDLAAYRAHFGLPVCSSANGCFKKVGAAASAVSSAIGGATSISAHPTSISAAPTTNISGWAAEADADMDAVSAVCRTCKIVLAEASSDQMSDLGNAVGAAVAAGSTVVNASFGSPESAASVALEKQFEPSPVKVVAAAGDSGPQALFPAAATNVIAVSGTSLDVMGLFVMDSLWSSSGGGCSHYFPRASYQPGWCGSNRSIADIAAVADPSNGIAFYDSALGGWGIVGGTSVATPIVASMLALSGNALKGTGAHELYEHAGYAPVRNGGSIAGMGTPTSLSVF